MGVFFHMVGSPILIMARLIIDDGVEIFWVCPPFRDRIRVYVNLVDC